MSTGRYVKSFDSRAERLVDPQEPARIWMGKPVTNTGFILPHGRGGYRHGFSGGCGCAGMGEDSTAGSIFGNILAVAALAGVVYLLFGTDFGSQKEKRPVKGSYRRVRGILGS